MVLTVRHRRVHGHGVMSKSVMQVWSSPNLQNLGRAFSEAIGQPPDRYNERYTDMDRAASMDGVPPHKYPPPGKSAVILIAPQVMIP